MYKNPPHLIFIGSTKNVNLWLVTKCSENINCSFNKNVILLLANENRWK